MCDYSLEHVKNAKAKKGDKIVTSRFINTVSKGFAFQGDLGKAACLLPGAQLAFAKAVQATNQAKPVVIDGKEKTIGIMPSAPQAVAKFVQVNQDVECAYRDALEFPSGEVVMLQQLETGQEATVIQMPAERKPINRRTDKTDEGSGLVAPVAREHEHV